VPAARLGVGRLALSLLLAALFGLSAPAAAGILIEAGMGDRPVRIVGDPERGLVQIMTGEERRLVDLENATVYLFTDSQAPRKLVMSDLPAPPGRVEDFTILPMGPGPQIADYPSTQFRVFRGRTICADLYANLGLARTLAPVMDALVLLDRLNALLEGTDRPVCERIPYATYRPLGWLLRVEHPDGETIETLEIDTDHAVAAADFALPEDAPDITEALRDRLATRETEEKRERH